MATDNANEMLLTVRTPSRTVLEKKVHFVLLRTLEGDLGVLHGHCAYTVQLASGGMLRGYRDKQETDTLTVMGGFAMIQDNQVTVLTTFAEHPDAVPAALEALEQERIKHKRLEQQAELEIHRAEKALRQTLVKRDVSVASIINQDIGGEDAPDEAE